MITSHALLQNNADPSEEEIRKALAGNLCLCTGYMQIVEAVKEAKGMKAELFPVVLPDAPAVLRLKSRVNQIKEPEEVPVVVKANHI